MEGSCFFGSFDSGLGWCCSDDCGKERQCWGPVGWDRDGYHCTRVVGSQPSLSELRGRHRLAPATEDGPLGLVHRLIALDRVSAMRSSR